MWLTPGLRMIGSDVEELPRFQMAYFSWTPLEFFQRHKPSYVDSSRRVAGSRRIELGSFSETEKRNNRCDPQKLPYVRYVGYHRK